MVVTVFAFYTIQASQSTFYVFVSNCHFQRKEWTHNHSWVTTLTKSKVQPKCWCHFKAKKCSF